MSEDGARTWHIECSYAVIMRNLFVVATLVSMLSSGCYVGRTQNAKNVNYVLNGGVALAGTAMMLSSAGGGGCSDDASCVGGAIADSGGVALGALLVGAAALAIGITVIVPTKYPTPDTDPDVIEVGRPTRALHSRVTGPGMKPAMISLR